eukprot:s528_g45.t1
MEKYCCDVVPPLGTIATGAWLKVTQEILKSDPFFAIFRHTLAGKVTAGQLSWGQLDFGEVQKQRILGCVTYPALPDEVTASEGKRVGRW